MYDAIFLKQGNHFYNAIRASLVYIAGDF